MNTATRGRRRTLLPTTRLAAVAGLVGLLAQAAPALEGAPKASSELVPTGARATIYLEPPSSAEDTVRHLALEAGKSAFVRTSYGVSRVSVGNPDVADVVVLKQRELQIIGNEPGTTNVVIWSASGEIEAAIDLHVTGAYSGVEAEIRRVVPESNVTVSAAAGSIVLSGSVPDAATLDRVIAIAGAYFPEKARDEGSLINLINVGGNQQVMIEVTVSEMSRDLRKAIGTNFAAHITQNGERVFDAHTLLDGLTSLDRSVEGDLISPDLIEEMVSISDQVNFFGAAFPIGTGAYELFVNALDETGLAKILAEPTLVARSGEEARFLAGGEIPIPIAQGGAFGSITIVFKEFGVGVAFTPTVMSEDRIHLDVTTEVSQIDFGLGTAVAGFTTPGFRTRRASTGVELGDGQVFAIAGLLRDELAEKVSQYPILGQIPIIGTLFRSSSYRKQMTELVLLVRPRLVKPLGPEPPMLPTDYFDEPNWFEFFLLGRAEGFDDQFASAEAEPEAGVIGDAGYRLPAVEYDDEEETR